MAQVSAHTCSLCDENNGAYYCYECQQALCTVCRNRHGKIPALSGHTVADINIVNLSTVNKTNSCDTHNKEIQFYCTECSDLICSKCVTSTHKSHSISDITDVVLEEREKAKENIKELKLKTEAISSLQEKIRREHIEKLHVESKNCIEHMESVCKDLHSFIEAKGSMKTTEVEDNENIETSNFEAFLKNTDLIQKQYVHILTELENLLVEKHDITFYSSYLSIQSNIQTLVNIPEEPPFAQVPSFDDEVLYREAMEHMESKIDKSLCQNCSVQKKKIEDLQLEYKICKETFHRGLETKDEELKTVSENVKLLQEEMTTMQSTFASATNQKDAQNKKLSENIESLKKKMRNRRPHPLCRPVLLSESANPHPIPDMSMMMRNRRPPLPSRPVLPSDERCRRCGSYFPVNLIAHEASKCVTSTHNTHPFSEITDSVLKDREKATKVIQNLKSKIEEISNLQEKSKGNHLIQLHKKSKECVELIESVCKELQSYIESKRDNKTIEIEDNENKEQRNFVAFLANTDLVHKRYTHMLSELENLRSEKHDVTFHSCYRSIQSEIQELVGIPNEPRLAEVPSFTKQLLHEEVIEYMKSKIETSTCKQCRVQKNTIKDLQLENKRYKNNNDRTIREKDNENRRLTRENQCWKDEKKLMEEKTVEKLYIKDLEKEKLLRDIKKELDAKEKELEKLTQEIKSSKEENMKLTGSSMQPITKKTPLRSPIEPCWERTHIAQDHYCGKCGQKLDVFVSLQIKQSVT